MTEPPSRTMYPCGCKAADCDFRQGKSCKHPKAIRKNRGLCDGGTIECMHWEKCSKAWMYAPEAE